MLLYGMLLYEDPMMAMQRHSRDCRDGHTAHSSEMMQCQVGYICLGVELRASACTNFSLRKPRVSLSSDTTVALSHIQVFEE
jgi:hypothetical protein